MGALLLNHPLVAAEGWAKVKRPLQERPGRPTTVGEDVLGENEIAGSHFVFENHHAVELVGQMSVHGIDGWMLNT
ncbi:MAG: hypothetical protein GXY83_35420 [Rhodopirellula sp.]|nr:hypothetical protein [Rhodopirellula sp.]